MLESPPVFTREAEIASTFGPIEKISMFLASWCRQKAVQQKWLSVLSSFSRDSTWRCYLLTSNEPGSLSVVKYHICSTKVQRNLHLSALCCKRTKRKESLKSECNAASDDVPSALYQKASSNLCLSLELPFGKMTFPNVDVRSSLRFFFLRPFRDCLPLCLSNDPWLIAEHATDNGRLAE